MLRRTDLTQPIHVGDQIIVRAHILRQATVTRVTRTFVWAEYIIPSGRRHNSMFRRYPPGVKPPIDDALRKQWAEIIETDVDTSEKEQP